MSEDDSKKRGRPPGETGEAKQAIVKVRCELSEKGQWTAKARQEGLKLSEWLRRRANN